jgi:hypothetical protein
LAQETNGDISSLKIRKILKKIQGHAWNRAVLNGKKYPITSQNVGKRRPGLISTNASPYQNLNCGFFEI